MKASKEAIKLYKKGKNFFEAGNGADGFFFIRKSAKKGYAPAQNNLGSAYAFGKGVEEDKKQAVHWWKLAAEQGDKNAQFILGAAYAFG